MSELPETNAAEAHRWLGQSREELRAAGRLASERDLPARIACFLAHLAAEKALKAYLIASGVPFPRVHDLADLFALLRANLTSASRRPISNG
jgi:HEPN domain-containing protein